MDNDNSPLVEVERKRELPDGGAAVSRRLSAMGFTAAEPAIETDVYFSRPDVDFVATVECLRVRSRNGFAEITYKPPTSAATFSTTGIVSKTETNVALASSGEAAAALALLENLGMPMLARVEKIRTAWRHPGVPDAAVTVDQVTGAGVFVEVEVLRPDADSAASLVEEIEKELGITECPVVTLPYRDLVIDAASGQ